MGLYKEQAGVKKEEHEKTRSASSQHGPSRERRVENRHHLMQSLIEMNSTIGSRETGAGAVKLKP